MDFESLCEKVSRKILADATADEAIEMAESAAVDTEYAVMAVIAIQVAAEMWPDNERLQELLAEAQATL